VNITIQSGQQRVGDFAYEQPNKKDDFAAGTKSNMYQTNRESMETFRLKNAASKNSNNMGIITLDPNETKHQVAPSIGRKTSNQD
jgi:hypothetical protein